MTIKECAREIADSSFETMLEDLEMLYSTEYDQLTYSKRKDFLKSLQKELNVKFATELIEVEKNKSETIDEIALLKRENARLKEQIRMEHSWDNCVFNGGA